MARRGVIEPITAAVLAATLLGEPMSPAGVLGIAAVLVGITVAATRAPTSPKP
jgi:drug/metabolite transporter (DMT)-like permease